MSEFKNPAMKQLTDQQVRFAPHVSGTALVKPRDYQLLPEGEAAAQEQVEASSPYAAFFALRDSGKPLDVGDLLEDENGSMRIFKFVGFEEAQWVLPEPKPPVEIQEQSAAVQ